MGRNLELFAVDSRDEMRPRWQLSYIHGVCRGILVASIGTAHDAPVDYKKERKERLKERRERLNEIVDREEEEEDAVPNVAQKNQCMLETEYFTKQISKQISGNALS